MPLHFYTNKHFYFKQFSLVWVRGLIVKNISISSYLVLIQIIQFSISLVFVHTQLNVKTVLFQTIQFCISTQFSSIWPIDRILSAATIPGQSGPGSDGNERVLRIPQSSSITGSSPSDFFSVISRTLIGGVLPLYREAVGVFYSPSQLGKGTFGMIWP